MPKLDDLLGLGPNGGASATSPPPVAKPKPVKLDDLLGITSEVAPLPSPSPALPYRAKLDPPVVAPPGNFATRMLDRAKAETAQVAKPFPMQRNAEDWRDLAKYRRPVPNEAQAKAEQQRKDLDTANILASTPMLPSGIADAFARKAGVSEADIARRGRAQSPDAGVAGLGPVAPGRGVVTGYPKPVREIDPSEDPMLRERRRQLAEKAATPAAQVAGAFSGEGVRSTPEGSGIAPRSSYGTVGEREGTAGLDYNPLGLAVGAADELYRNAKAVAAPLVEGITGKRPDVDTERGFLPPIEAPSVNIGRTVAGAPMAVAGLVAEKTAPLAVAIQNGDWGAAMDHLLGGEVGNTYTGESKAKNKGDGTFLGSVASGLDALEEGIANTPRELWGLASMPLHAAQGAYNFGAKAIRGDAPVRETFRPVVDTAASVASGTLRDTAKMVLDPKAKLEEGLLSTVSTAAPLAGSLRKWSGVDESVAAAKKLRDEATALRSAPYDATRTVMDVADEGEKLRATQRAKESEVDVAQGVAGSANTAATLERTGYTKTGEGPNLEIQAKARADELAKARAEMDAARVVAETFDAQHQPALQKAFDDIAAAKRKAHLAEGRATAAEFAARAPLHYATLGASAVYDLVGLYASRKLDKAGNASGRRFLRTPDERVPYMEDIAREVGREANTRAILAQDAYRAIPESARPDIRKALHMEHTMDEGGYYAPGHDYTEHINTYENGKWGYTPYGQRWLDGHRKTIADAEREIAAATSPDAVDAAKSRKLAAEDAIQKSDSFIAGANQHAQPLAKISDDVTADQIALGEIDPFDAEVWKTQRETNIKAATDAHDARVAKADAEFQRVVSQYRRDTSANVRGVDRIAERVIARASGRQQVAARQAESLTGRELTAQERRLAPRDRVTGPAGDDAALRTREAEVAAEGAANRRLGARIADVRMQQGRDVAALDAPYGAAVSGITQRAQRVIDRAKAARDRVVADSAAKTLEEINKLRSEPIPTGLRRTQWRQTYNTDDARDRRALTDSTMAGKAAQSRAQLGPTRQSKELLGTEFRAARMPMRRREEEYGMSTKLGDEVNALLQRVDDVATLKLYKGLADKYGLDDAAYQANRAVDMGVENAMRRREGLAPLENRGRITETSERYIKVPDNAKFPKLENSPKEYGALAGKWVPEDLWFEMVNQKAIKEEMATLLNRGVSWWKFGKTVLSPMTHARNFLSNALLFAPSAGLSLTNPKNWGHFWDALKDMTAAEKSDFFRQLEAGGMFDSAMAKSEMQLKALDDVHSGFIDHVTGPMRGLVQGMYETGVASVGMARQAERIARKNEAANKALLHQVGTDQKAWAELRKGMDLPSQGRKLREGVSKITDATRQIIATNPGAFYRAQDDLFRLALANKLRAQGMPLDQIIATGKKSFVDYANVPGFVQVLRAPVAPVYNRRGDKANSARYLFFVGGQPFLAFTAAAVPMVRDWVQRDPWRAQMYMNLHESLSRANLAAMGMTEDDATALRKSGRSWEQGQALIGEVFPQWGRAENGDPIATDVNYLAPTGQLTPDYDPYANDWVKGVDYVKSVANIGPGPLLQPVFDFFAKRDSFTGQDLAKRGDTSAESRARMVSLLYQALAPGMAPSIDDIAAMFTGGPTNINDPTRWKGGYQYERGRAASQGAPDAAGRESSMGEFVASQIGGSKLARMNVTDRALDHATRVQSVSNEAIDAATKEFSPYLRLTDTTMPEDTRAKILTSYRNRMLPKLTTLREVIGGLARGEGRNDHVVTALSDELDIIARETNPETFYDAAKSTLAYFARELSTINAERRAAKDELWRASQEMK